MRKKVNKIKKKKVKLIYEINRGKDRIKLVIIKIIMKVNITGMTIK
jgi:hypothetical protein